MNTVEPLEVTLNVRATPMAVSVNLQIRNCTDRPVLIEKISPDVNQPLPHEFVITSNGKEIEYIGPMIKRPPYARGDFRWLQPGEKIERNLNIENLFEFLPGAHEYKIVHVYLGYNEKSDEVTEHESAPSFFSYTRKVALQTSP